MRLIVRLAAYTIVLTIATVIAFAGPCEDGCNFNNTACTGAANSTYSQCSSAVSTQSTNCYQEADQTASGCYFQGAVEHAMCLATSHQQEQSICNQNLGLFWNNCAAARDDAYNYCMITSGVGQEQCEFAFQMDQQACANDYDNCLFVCSVQNP